MQNNRHTLSVIVPAYNEEVELPQTLSAIRTAAEQAGISYEIVLADDGSTDETAAIGRDFGANVIAINSRHIAAARNAGARAARGDILLFVDADTRISGENITQLQCALADDGCAGGGARLQFDRELPRWGRIFFRIFSAIYFGFGLGAGAFLFTTRENFEKIGGFDERYFAGEEIFFTLALRRLGRFRILQGPVITSGRKLHLYSRGKILRRSFFLILAGRRAVMSRRHLDVWYGGARERRVP